MRRLPAGLLGIIAGGMGLQAFGELRRAEGRMESEDRAEQATRSGIGTGKCACGKRISKNKGACLACSPNTAFPPHA